MSNLVRKNILTITPYKAGKPIEETKRELGLKEVIKLASNENPLGPSPKALAEMKKSICEVNRYPDSNGFYLKNKIAQTLKITAGNVVLGNGSDELIDTIIKTFVEEDENIVTAQTTFLEYEIIAKVNNRKVKKVPLKDFRYDLQAMRKVIDEKTKLVFIANPNNPTGTYITNAELNSFLSGLPSNVIVVVDEAYDTFIDVTDFPSTLNLFRNVNLISLRTFSKAYGLAGLRIGYAILKEDLAAYMEMVRQPFNANLIAQKAAVAALDDSAFLAKTRNLVLDGKKSLSAAFTKLKLKYVPSVANFILVDTGKDCLVIFKELLKEGVIVRDMKQYGLDTFVRITIGTAKENKKLIAALKKIIS